MLQWTLIQLLHTPENNFYCDTFHINYYVTKIRLTTSKNLFKINNILFIYTKMQILNNLDQNHRHLWTRTNFNSRRRPFWPVSLWKLPTTANAMNYHVIALWWICWPSSYFVCVLLCHPPPPHFGQCARGVLLVPRIIYGKRASPISSFDLQVVFIFRSFIARFRVEWFF